MNRIFLSFFVVILALTTNAQPPEGDAKPGEWYGEKPNPQGAINISEIPLQLAKKEAFETKVRGKIVDVCSRKGCWIKLQVNDSTTAMVEMKDYGFFLPLAAKGKTIVLEGAVKMKTTSVKELKHYADDAGKSKEEIAAITKPEKEIKFTAKGIMIVE